MNSSVLSERDGVPSILPYMKCWYLENNSWHFSSIKRLFIYIYIFIYMLLKSWSILFLLRDNHLKENIFVQIVRTGCYLESAGSLSGLGKSGRRGHVFFFTLHSYKSTSFLSPIRMAPGCFLHKRLVITCWRIALALQIENLVILSINALIWTTMI